MAGVKTTSSTHFEATYEAPWGGVASNAPAFDIAPGQLVMADGVSIRNGVLCYSNISSQDTIYSLELITPTNVAVTDPTTGLPDSLNFPGAYICLIFNAGDYLCAVDQYGFSYIATIQSNGKVQFQLDQIAENGADPNFGVPTAVKVVNGIAYISVYSSHTLYAYIPTASYLIASTYCAGQYIDIFEEYMVQLNTNSAVDGIQKSRINWSSPDEFGMWDAAVNRTAGFQSLTSSENYISGFVATDNVGYIFRKEGITQITATGVAIQPFNFTTYWNSVAGQGLIFPNTLIQYGREVFLATDSNVYQFSSGAFSPIGEVAKASIFSSFNDLPTYASTINLAAPPAYTATAGGFFIYSFNDTVPGAEYLFAAAPPIADGVVVFWLYSIANKAWTSITKNAYGLISEFIPDVTPGSVVVNFIKTATVFLNVEYNDGVTNAPTIPNLPTALIYINFTYGIQSDFGVSFQKTFVFCNTVNTPTSTSLGGPAASSSLFLLFKQEQLKMGRQPNIRRVIVFACGSGTLEVSVNGEVFTEIVLDGTPIYRVYYADGIITEELPQLTITSSNFNGRIAKAMMVGSYGDGELD